MAARVTPVRRVPDSGPEFNTDVVAEARTWIGTPYQHQMSLKGVGCDCLGLVRGVWRARQGDEPWLLPPYTADWAETGTGEPLCEGLARYLKPIENAKAQAGDVLVFRLRTGAVAKHAAILRFGDLADPRAKLIHAYWGHAVVETWLGTWWRRHVVAAFRF